MKTIKLLIILITLLFTSCVSTKSFNTKEAGIDAPEYTEFINLKIISKDNEFKYYIYADTYTGLLYQGNLPYVSPIYTIEGKLLTYKEWQTRN